MTTTTQTGSGKYERLLTSCRHLPPVHTAVAHPCEATALSGALEGAAHGLIAPILVGPTRKIEEIAAANGIDLGKARIVDAPHSHAAAAKAVELVRKGEAELLMKGSLHTDELLGAVVARETGLRTGRRVSHVFIMDVPTYPEVSAYHRRGAQHRTRSRCQARYPAESHRPGAGLSEQGGTRCHLLRRALAFPSTLEGHSRSGRRVPRSFRRVGQSTAPLFRRQPRKASALTGVNARLNFGPLDKKANWK